MFGFGGGSGFNAWTWIILILIVLQWFRVGYGGVGGIGGVGGVPGGPVVAEPGLMANGGLFIIAIFLLVACGCFRGPVMPAAVSPVRYC
jgi:hypothetical protein